MLWLVLEGGVAAVKISISPLVIGTNRIATGR
jgi:hypothetical protein